MRVELLTQLQLASMRPQSEEREAKIRSLERRIQSELEAQDHG
jgi:hypothetical protein